jgi:superfamily II DNA or RNA helicase
MTNIEEKIIDNNSGLIDKDLEGSVTEVFEHYCSEAVDDLSDSGFRVDIGAGFLFFSGFQETHDAFQQLKDKGKIAKVEDDDEWGTESPIRVVMGNKTSHFTKKILQDLVRDGVSDYTDETVTLLRDLIEEDLIDFRVVTDKKFHPKIYSFYFDSEYPDEIWSGSANFSVSGLQDNIELCVPMRATYNTRQNYRQWFDNLWALGTEDLNVLDVIDDVEDSEYLYYSPKVFFSKLIKLLDKEYLLEDAPGIDDDVLLEFQNLTYNIVMNRLHNYGGYVLANSVGTGKTYVACQTAATYLNLKPKDVLVIAPPNVEDEWRDTLEEFEIETEVDIESMGNLQKPHRSESDDQSFQFDERKYKEEYSLIIVDEAHGYRNDSNRRENLEEIIKANREADVLLTTATPINLSPNDLFQLIDLFRNGKRKEKFKSSQLHQTYVEARRRFKDLDNYNNFDKGLLEDIKTIEKELSIKITWRIIQDEFEEDLYQLAGEEVSYEDPDVEEISYNYPEDIREDIFEEIVPFLQNLNYEPAKLWSGNEYEESKNLIFLQKWRLYKQLESSLAAFQQAVKRLYVRNQVYQNILDNKEAVEEGDIGEIQDKSEEFSNTLGDDSFENLISQDEKRIRNMVSTFTELDEDLQDSIKDRIEEDSENTREILDKLEAVCGEEDQVPRNGDTKSEEMVELVKECIEEDKPVLIFSEFTPSVEYIHDFLVEELPEYEDRIDFIHGYEGRSKKKFVDRFERGEIDVAITTDMLSEGVNIPRADVVVNYDLPYNPTKLVQRAGRALRITNPKKIEIKNFTPDDTVNKELELYERLDARLESILQIAGLDFVVWMMDEKKVESLHEEERKEYLSHLNEYEEELQTQNPEEISSEETPGMQEEDRVLREAVNKFDIGHNLIDRVKPPANKPIYTTLAPEEDEDYAVIGRSGDTIQFWQKLSESIEPNHDAPEVKQGLTQEDKNYFEELATEERERLEKERTSADSRSRRNRQVDELVIEASERLESEEMNQTLSKIRRGIENDGFTKGELDDIEEACEDISGYREMVRNIDDAVQERDSWKRLSELADKQFDTDQGEPETQLKAVIKYTEEES